jgi:hypothetical protein
MPIPLIWRRGESSGLVRRHSSDGKRPSKNNLSRSMTREASLMLRTWRQCAQCETPRNPRTLRADGNTRNDGAPAHGRRLGARRPSFTGIRGEQLSGLRFENGDKCSKGNVLPIFGLLHGSKQAATMPIRQIINARLQFGIGLQRKESTSRLRRQALAKWIDQAIEDGKDCRRFHVAIIMHPCRGMKGRPRGAFLN